MAGLNYDKWADLNSDDESEAISLDPKELDPPQPVVVANLPRDVQQKEKEDKASVVPKSPPSPPVAKPQQHQASLPEVADPREHAIRVPQHPQPPGVMPGIVQLSRQLLEQAQKQAAGRPNPPNPSESSKAPNPSASATEEDPKAYRRLGHEVFFGGRRIYGWEQDLEEVRIQLQVPPGVTLAKQLRVEIEADHLRVGLRGADRWFLDEPLEHLVVPDECLWTLIPDPRHPENGGELELQLQKAELGQVWLAALHRHPKLGPEDEQLLRKRLLLERFGRENPGFDFSNAVVNGRAPEVSDFMGGVDRNRFQK